MTSEEAIREYEMIIKTTNEFLDSRDKNTLEEFKSILQNQIEMSKMALYALRIQQRLGKFGELFADYEGDPRGARGPSCKPLEEAVFDMPPLVDVDGGKWVPVCQEELNDLVGEYMQIRADLEQAERDRDAYMICTKDLLSKDNCNNCGDRYTCRYLPRPGETVRVNCPLWIGQQEGPEANAPLTMSDLLEMIGEPVYIHRKNYPGGCGWRVVESVDVYALEIKFTDGDWFSFADHGKHWLAYRRKPEDGTV